MLTFENFSIVLFILPIYQVLYYTIQLITFKKKNDPSRLPLGILMLIMTIYLIVNASNYLGYQVAYRYLIIFQLPILLAVAPTYFIYLASITNSKTDLVLRSKLIYYLPSLFILLLNFIAFAGRDTEQFNKVVTLGDSLGSFETTPLKISYISFILGNFGFVGYQFVIIFINYFKKFISPQKSQQAEIEKLNYFQPIWSHMVMISIIIFISLSSLINFITPAYNSMVYVFINIGLIISVGVIGYLTSKQDKLFLLVDKIKINYPTIVEGTINYSDSNNENVHISPLIDTEESKMIIAQLQSYLITNKPYLNSKLSIVDLANNLGISKRKLTYVVNEVMENNFYGIINKHRVLEAKEVLKKVENQNFTIEVISQMVGFKSKSSFNACFKQITGVTPSEYRKNNGKV